MFLELGDVSGGGCFLHVKTVSCFPDVSGPQRNRQHETFFMKNQSPKTMWRRLDEGAEALVQRGEPGVKQG